jgi:hypothetical protein
MNKTDVTEIDESQAEESTVLGQKKWVDTIELQLVRASYEILKTGGDAPPDMIANMSVQELLELITSNKLRLTLEKI